MFSIGSVSGGYLQRGLDIPEGGHFYEFLEVGAMSTLAFLCNAVVKVSIQWLRSL